MHRHLHASHSIACYRTRIYRHRQTHRHRYRHTHTHSSYWNTCITRGKDAKNSKEDSYLKWKGAKQEVRGKGRRQKEVERWPGSWRTSDEAKMRAFGFCFIAVSTTIIFILRRLETYSSANPFLATHSCTNTASSCKTQESLKKNASHVFSIFIVCLK